MKPLTPDEMKEFRTYIAVFDVSDEQKDLLISFLYAIAASFVHQVFLKSSVQLSLSSRAKFAFTGGKPRANMPISEKSELDDLDRKGAINTEGSKRQLAP